ncbi:MAG: CCA tRNA nucleotidyltransferase [Chlorobiota bacterium]
MKIEIKDKILETIGLIADEYDYEIYIIGGYVRDKILGISKTDYDITVVGDAIKFANIVAKKLDTKVVEYARFRTALVPYNKVQIEFVGTRIEEYTKGSRKPKVVEGTLFDDIKRRDFTVNTLAASLNKSNFGVVIDEFNGLKHIEEKLLVTPLDPIVTYKDDPLRMMRAARFASQLKFNIEEESFQSIKSVATEIVNISQERVTDEFFKILKTEKPSIGLNVLMDTGLLEIIFPEVYNLRGVDKVEKNGRVYAHKDVFYHTLEVIDNISQMTDNVWLRFVALMHDIAKPPTKRFSDSNGWTFHGHEELGARWQKRIFRKLKLPMDKLPYVEKLVRLHQRPMALVDEEATDSAYRRLAAQAGNDLEDLFVHCKADITTKNERKAEKYLKNYDRVLEKILQVQENDKLKEFQSPVRGEEIMNICNIKPSKLVGLIKNEIEEAILEGIIPNDYEKAKDYFLENKDEWISKFK